MSADARAQQAREHHRAASASDADAARHREHRDRLVRRLREEDPETWTYARLAAAVGCKPELIRWIITGDQGRRR